MPRNGSGVFSLPAGSTVANGDVSDATDINTPLSDIATDLNTPRPVVAGGTGASTAAGALVNLGLTATAAELNILDGVMATAAELNILDGVTATTAEINKLAGTPVGLTATELGYVDGVTSAIQTQLDAKQPLDADLTALAGIAGVEGDIIYRNATQWTRLAKGTAAQVLTMNGGATAPAWATPAAMSSITLLGSITTTSGASQTISGLDLTSYKSIRLVYKAVSPNAAANFYIDTTASVVCVASNANNIFRGLVDLDLEDGTYSANLALVSSSGLASAASQPYGGKTGITTASTSIVIGVSAGAFDAGSVLVYGVK